MTRAQVAARLPRRRGAPLAVELPRGGRCGERLPLKRNGLPLRYHESLSASGGPDQRNSDRGAACSAYNAGLD